MVKPLVCGLSLVLIGCSEAELSELKDPNYVGGMDIEVTPAALDFGLLIGSLL